MKFDFGYVGGLQALTSSARLHLQQMALMTLYCHCMESLVFENDQNRILLVATGAVPLMLDVMKLYAADAGIQTRGCTLLTNLGHNSGRMW